MTTSLSSYSCLALAILALTSQFGCLALNIPSERMFDPGDHGGILGDWETDPEGCSDGTCEHPTRCMGDLSFDGGPLDSDPLDPLLDENGNPLKEKDEEVPWPRFHPVPTRPVFGDPAIQ